MITGAIIGDYGRHFPLATYGKILATCTRVPQAKAQFVLKIEKLSHIMGTAPIVELRLRSPSPIMAPDDYCNLIVFEKFCFQNNKRKDGVFKFLRFDERF